LLARALMGADDLWARSSHATEFMAIRARAVQPCASRMKSSNLAVTWPVSALN